MALRDVAPPLQFPPRPLTSLPDLIRIPLSTPAIPTLRFASLEDRDNFGKAWRTAPLVADPTSPGFYQIDFQVPAGVTGDDVPVVLSIAGSPTDTRTMSIRAR